MQLMTRLVALALVAGAIVAPLAAGHALKGTTNPTCQSDTGDWDHDYLLGPAPILPTDGNQVPCTTRSTYGWYLFTSDGPTNTDPHDNCDGNEYDIVENVVADPRNGVAFVPEPAYSAVCNTAHPSRDWDGDYDWALGGAVLSWDLAPPSSAPQASCGSGAGQTPCATTSTSPNCTTTYPGCFDAVRGGGDHCWGFDVHTHSGTIYADADFLGVVGHLHPIVDATDFIEVTAATNWRRAAFDALPGNGHQNCGDTLVEPCGLPGQVDQVNCNGRDWMVRSGPSTYTAIFDTPVKFVPGPASGGQDGVVLVFIGSLGCPIAEATSLTDACVNTLLTKVQTAAIGGHIWTTYQGP